MITTEEIQAADTAYWTTDGDGNLKTRWTAALTAAYAARPKPSIDAIAAILYEHVGADPRDQARLIVEMMNGTHG
jgi:hypothetical protein